MSNNSAPVFERAPTFDEVVEYAVNNGIFGKISLTKFYEYYGDFKGKGGLIIDWKAKLRMWADHQRSAIIVSTKEYEARERIQKREEKKRANRDVIADLQARVAMI